MHIRTTTTPITSFAPTLPILVHLSDELVDVVFPVTEVTAQNIVLEFACPPTTGWVRKLKRPQEVRCLTVFQKTQNKIMINWSTYLLEVWASSGDFMNEVFNGEDVVLPKR